MPPSRKRSFCTTHATGVESPSQAARVAGLGYGLALVGTALMRAPDPAAQVASLLAAGRASACEARAR